MHKLFLITFFLFGFYNINFCQNGDTLYFDKLWHPCAKVDSKYYRLIEQVDGLYKIRDFFNNGVLQMEAGATSINPEILDGKCSYYYENGNVKATGTYIAGKETGVWYYYNKKGNLTDTYNYTLYREKQTAPIKQYSKAISERDKIFSIALRGKVAGFVIIEDNYFSTATIGTEFLFKGRHSLGIDYTYFGWQYERDNTDDVALYETYERRSYMYVDYKYRMFSYKIVDVYFNMYDKYGTYHMWQEGVFAGYNTSEKPWLKDKTDGTFNQVGAGLGVKVYLSDRFYLDGSVNGGKLFSDNNTISHDSLGIATQQFHLKSEKNIFYIRINLGYKFFVKYKKDEDMFYTN